MIVSYSSTKSKSKQAELYALGDCLAVEVDGHLQRVGPLSAGQWALLSESAGNRAESSSKPCREPAKGKFVAIGKTVMRADEFVANAASHTLALRIARALNNHKPNARGF